MSMNPHPENNHAERDRRVSESSHQQTEHSVQHHHHQPDNDHKSGSINHISSTSHHNSSSYPTHQPHTLTHLSSISNTKKAVEYDSLSHQPSVSSISNDFVVHTGPIMSHVPVGVGIGTTDHYIVPRPSYETEYEHAFLKPHPNDYDHHNLAHHLVDHLADHITDQLDKTKIHHNTQESVHMNKSNRGAISLDLIWSDMDATLTSLAPIMGYERVWLDLALTRVKDRRWDSAMEYAYIRLKEKVKEGVDEKHMKHMTPDEVRLEHEKLRWAEMFVMACDEMRR